MLGHGYESVVELFYSKCYIIVPDLLLLHYQVKLVIWTWTWIFHYFKHELLFGIIAATYIVLPWMYLLYTVYWFLLHFWGVDILSTVSPYFPCLWMLLYSNEFVWELTLCEWVNQWVSEWVRLQYVELASQLKKLGSLNSDFLVFLGM